MSAYAVERDPFFRAKVWIGIAEALALLMDDTRAAIEKEIDALHFRGALVLALRHAVLRRQLLDAVKNADVEAKRVRDEIDTLERTFAGTA